LIQRLTAREDVDRLLLGMLKLPPRCRDLMRLKLIEQKSYAEIRTAMGISGNVYETARRCFHALLRHMGGPA
jgi:DNA-directed RNA polymerase specialized sigma24 family protein